MRIVASFSIACASLVVATLGTAAEQSDQLDQKTAKLVPAGIEGYVANDVKLKKHFLILDPRSEEPLRPVFDHRHAGLARRPAGSAACVDFKDSAGKVFDVGFVIARTAAKLEVREVFLHKVAGESVITKPKTAE